jgi:hypothetical protein
MVDTPKLSGCPFCGRKPTLKKVKFSAEVLAQVPEPEFYCGLVVKLTLILLDAASAIVA